MQKYIYKKLFDGTKIQKSDGSYDCVVTDKIDLADNKSITFIQVNNRTIAVHDFGDGSGFQVYINSRGNNIETTRMALGLLPREVVELKPQDTMESIRGFLNDISDDDELLVVDISPDLVGTEPRPEQALQVTYSDKTSKIIALF